MIPDYVTVADIEAAFTPEHCAGILARAAARRLREPVVRPLTDPVYGQYSYALHAVARRADPEMSGPPGTLGA
jgi:hypothetical protein